MTSQLNITKRSLGVVFNADRAADILVWAPWATSVAVKLHSDSTALPLTKSTTGDWLLTTDKLKPGDQYSFVLDDEKVYPDPASLAQPQGLYGPSQAINTAAFFWEDSCWVNPSVDDYMIYEIDVKAFTPEGTLDGVAHRLGHLKELGINAIGVSPVTPFPNAGEQYVANDFLFAIPTIYGSALQFQHLVNACHYEGIAVIIDIVYDLAERQGDEQTADEALQQARRRYLTENALMWFRDFHVDAIRFEADTNLPEAKQLVTQIRECTNALTARTGRHHYLLVEQVAPATPTERTQPEQGGLPLLANGDLYYPETYAGAGSLIRTFRNDCLYDTQFSMALEEFFDKEPEAELGELFSVISHRTAETKTDLTQAQPAATIRLESLKLLAGSLLVSPHIPTLMMGEEWGGDNPFNDQTQLLYQYHQALTALRRDQPALHHPSRKQIALVSQHDDQVVFLHRWHKDNHVLCLMNFSPQQQPVTLPNLNKKWRKLLDSAEPRWQGPGAAPDSLSDADTTVLQPESIVIYRGK